MAAIRGDCGDRGERRGQREAFHREQRRRENLSQPESESAGTRDQGADGPIPEQERVREWLTGFHREHGRQLRDRQPRYIPKSR